MFLEITERSIRLEDSTSWKPCDVEKCAHVGFIDC